MRHSGSTFEFTTERNKELMKSYREAIRSCRHIDTEEVATAVANSPTSRFWVSEERATVVVKNLLLGKNVLEKMRKTKREMFSEIYRRFLELRSILPHLHISELVSRVVNSPAPRFYLTPRSAMETIRKILAGHYNG